MECGVSLTFSPSSRSSCASQVENVMYVIPFFSVFICSSIKWSKGGEEKKRKYVDVCCVCACFSMDGDENVSVFVAQGDRMMHCRTQIIDSICMNERCWTICCLLSLLFFFYFFFVFTFPTLHRNTTPHAPCSFSLFYFVFFIYMIAARLGFLFFLLLPTRQQRTVYIFRHVHRRQQLHK